jgi:hypothetical protein
MRACWYLFSGISLLAPSALALKHLALTALLSDDHGLRFECWQMQPPFSKYPTAGSAITGLADVANVSYVVLPPRSDEGLHKPPHPMCELVELESAK